VPDTGDDHAGKIAPAKIPLPNGLVGRSLSDNISTEGVSIDGAGQVFKQPTRAYRSISRPAILTDRHTVANDIEESNIATTADARRTGCSTRGMAAVDRGHPSGWGFVRANS